MSPRVQVTLTDVLYRQVDLKKAAAKVVLDGGVLKADVSEVELSPGRVAASAVVDGEAVYSEEVVWSPGANTDPDYPHPMAPEYQDYPYENGAQMGLIKPDLSAYGSGTTATCPGPFYCTFSGTSSA